MLDDSKIRKELHKIPSEIIVAVSVALILLTLKLLFGELGESVITILKYYVYEYKFSAIAAVLLLIILRRSQIKYRLLISIVAILFLVRIDYVVNQQCHFSPGTILNYREFDLGYIELNTEGEYVYSANSLEFTSGHRGAFNSNILPSHFSATTTIQRDEVFIPSHILQYYSLKKLSIKDLVQAEYSCGSHVRWQEINSKNEITNIGFYSEYPFVWSTDLGDSYNLLAKLNFLKQVGLSNKARGEYLGSVYSAFFRGSGIQFDSTNGEWEKAMISIKSSEDILLNALEDLRSRYLSGARMNDENFEEFYDQERNNWLYRVNLMRFYVHWERGDEIAAETSLVKTFENQLLSKGRSSYEAFFSDFADRYFGVNDRKMMDSQFVLNEITRNGLKISFSDYDEDFDTLDSVLEFYLTSKKENLDIDVFFENLSKKYPKNPIVFFYWGKSYTIRTQYQKGAEMYAKSMELFPNEDVIKIFYYTALMNEWEQTDDSNIDIEKAVEEQVKAVKRVDERIIVPDEFSSDI